MVMVMVTPGYTGTSPGRTGRQTSRSRRTWTCTQGRRAPRTSWSVAGWACAGASACSCWSRSSGGTYAAQPANNKHKKQNLFQKHIVEKLAPGKRAFIHAPLFLSIQSWTFCPELSEACPWRTWSCIKDKTREGTTMKVKVKCMSNKGIMIEGTIMILKSKPPNLNTAQLDCGVQV